MVQLKRFFDAKIVFLALISRNVFQFAAIFLSFFSLSAEAFFFENSLRRQPTSDEEIADAIVQVFDADGSPVCTGFYVRSDSNSAYVMTAQHCVDYNMASWCKRGGKIKDARGKKTRKCKQIVTGTHDSDLILLEFDGPKPEVGLVLSAVPPPTKLFLTMYGFPIDSTAFAGLNVTENCWILAQRGTLSATQIDGYEDLIQDSHFTHNCSTYGGNSGGPMLAEGTLNVVGMPWEYSYKRFKNRSSWKSVGADAISMASFVTRFRDKLESRKIELAFSLKENRVESRFFIPFYSGKFQGSKCLSGWTGRFQAVYNTTNYLNEIRASWTFEDNKAQDLVQVIYSCDGGVCVTKRGLTLRLIPNTPYEVEYTEKKQSLPCRMKMKRTLHY